MRRLIGHVADTGRSGGAGGGAASIAVLYNAALNPQSASPIAIAGAGGGASFSGNVPQPTGGNAGGVGQACVSSH